VVDTRFGTTTRAIEVTTAYLSQRCQHPLAPGGLLLLYLLWQITRVGGPRHQVLIGDLANIPFYVLVIGATMAAGRRCRATPRLARSWRLLAAGNACYLTGMLLQTYEEVVRHHLSYPGPPDVAFLSFFVFFAGLIGFARSERSSTRRLMLRLDMLTVALGGSAVMWYFVAGPSALADGQPWLQIVLAVAYPMGDLLLLVGATAALLRGLPESSRRSLSVTIAGVLIYVVADFIWDTSSSMAPTTAVTRWTPSGSQPPSSLLWEPPGNRPPGPGISPPLPESPHAGRACCRTLRWAPSSPFSWLSTTATRSFRS
jgi:hypothetical protein